MTGMAGPLRFTDLAPATRRLGWLILPPLLLTIRGFMHGLDSLHWLTTYPALLPVEDLPWDLKHILQTDDRLRSAQIGLTMLFLAYFCFAWLPVAFRNLLVMQGVTEDPGVLKRITRGLLTASRMLRELFDGSAHPEHAHLTLRYTIPACALALISANICKITAVVKMGSALTVADWLSGERWMLGAYAGYALLYVLAWRLAVRLEFLQRASWQKVSRP